MSERAVNSRMEKTTLTKEELFFFLQFVTIIESELLRPCEKGKEEEGDETEGREKKNRQREERTGVGIVLYHTYVGCPRQKSGTAVVAFLSSFLFSTYSSMHHSMATGQDPPHGSVMSYKSGCYVTVLPFVPL